MLLIIIRLWIIHCKSVSWCSSIYTSVQLTLSRSEGLGPGWLHPGNAALRSLGISQSCYRNIQFSSVTQSCPTLQSHWLQQLSLPVHHQLPEITQTHVHWVGDAIQPSYPLSSPFPPAFNLSQHQGLFQWVSSSDQVAKVLEFQLQNQSFQCIPRTDLL